jgi:hypothetical protein
MPKKHPDVKVKIKILTTVARSIYAQTLTKIREAVTNSIDNHASRFLFSLEKRKDIDAYVLSLFDNGHGITKSRFEEILQSIGYGLHMDEPHPEKYYSFFGLGLMSIFQLGKKITIITKSKDGGQFNKLTVDSAKIFSKEMEKESIEALNKCFVLDDSSEKERSDISPVTDQTLKKELGSKAKYFTEIIIEELHEEDLKTITSEENAFFEDLSKILPLAPNEADHFLAGLNVKDKQIILNILKDRDYCPVISFKYSMDNAKYLPLYKYFPAFRKPPTKNKYQLHSDTMPEFSYYLISCGRDLGVIGKNQRETGLWFRNKNVLVKAADYLPHPGLEPLADQPIQDWMFGEFFHKDMNEFLQVSRDEFDRSKEKYKEFRRQVREIVKKYSDHLRAAYEIGKKVKEAIKDPLDDIRKNSDKSPFRKMEESIKKILEVDEILEDKEPEVIDILSKIHNSDLEKCPEVIEALRAPLTIENREKGYILIIDPKAEEETIKYLEDKATTEVVIPSTTFQSESIPLFGRDYKVRYRNGKDIDAGISFNFQTREISVNPFYPNLMKYSLSFLDVFIALEYAYYSAGCTDQPAALECMDNMKKAALEFLGSKHVDRSEYMRSLKERL